MSLKFLFAIALSFSLTGCAAFYTFEGTKYDNKEAFHAAVDAQRSASLAKIQKLPSPLTEKTLIFAIPSADALISASKKQYVKIEGHQPIGIASEILENVPRANHKMSVVFGDAIEKRGIFASVKFVSLDSMESSIQPTSKEDVLYFSEPTFGSGQWFYSSAKHGKQVFAFDRSQPGVDGKITAFLEATQAQAIRE